MPHIDTTRAQALDNPYIQQVLGFLFAFGQHAFYTIFDGANQASAIAAYVTANASVPQTPIRQVDFGL